MIAHVFKQLLRFFRLAVRSDTWRKAQSSRDVWKLMQGALFRPMQHSCSNTHVFIIGIDTSPHPGVDEGFRGGPDFDVANHLAIRREDKPNILFRIEARRTPFITDCIRNSDLIASYD